MTDLNRKISATVVLVLVLGVALFALTRGGRDPRSGSSLMAQGGSAPRSSVIAGLGVVEPRFGVVETAALMPGVLSVINVREGDRVRKGDILAELVNDDLKAKVAQAEASLAAKIAQRNLVMRGPRPEEVKRAEAQLREEESTLRLLQLQFNRRQNLVRDGAVSAEAFNEVSSRMAASRERVAALGNSVAILRQGSRPEEIESAKADVSLAESQLAEARASLGKSFVRASIDGIVLRRYREPGEALSTQPAIAVMQIADVSDLVVRTQIDETDILDVRVGQSATITATALAGRKLTGRVDRISPRVGAKTINSDTPTEKRDTRVLDVIIALEPGSGLPVNFRVDVVIDLKSAPAPEAAPRTSSDQRNDQGTAQAPESAAEDGVLVSRTDEAPTASTTPGVAASRTEDSPAATVEEGPAAIRGPVARPADPALVASRPAASPGLNLLEEGYVAIRPTAKAADTPAEPLFAVLRGSIGSARDADAADQLEGADAIRTGTVAAAPSQPADLMAEVGGLGLCGDLCPRLAPVPQKGLSFIERLVMR